MTRYTGRIISTARTPETEPAGTFAPDPRHAVRDTPEYYGGVHHVPADTGIEYEMTAFPDDVMIGHGMPLATHTRSHAGLAGRRQIYTDDQYRDSISVRHCEDGQHRYRAHRYNQPPTQDHSEVYSDQLYADNTWDTNPNNSGAVAVLRGNKTSIPQNNPAGVREGLVRTWIMRADRRLGRRRYGYPAQPAYDRGSQISQEPSIVGPDNPDPRRAGSLFATLPPVGVYSRLKEPALYRAPVAVDDTALSTSRLGDTDVIGGGL